jgi:hypothetical protein
MTDLFLLRVVTILCLSASSLCGLSGQSVQTICANSTWSNCGVAVKQELNKKPSDPKEILQMGLAWGKGTIHATMNFVRADVSKVRLQMQTRCLGSESRKSIRWRSLKTRL